MKMNKKVLAASIAAALLTGSVANGSLLIGGPGTTVHANGQLMPALGYEEATADYFSSKAADEGLVAAFAAIPSSYNTEVKTLQYVSSVKNQGSLSTCWAFAATSALETAVMKANNETNPAVYDFSENHMRYALSSDGDNPYGYTRDNAGAGNMEMAIAYWERGVEGLCGPVKESDDPLTWTQMTRPAAETALKKADCYYVTRILNIPNLKLDCTEQDKQNYVEDTKKYIYEYGAVSAGYYASTTSIGYNKDPYRYHDNIAYHTTSEATNHNITIVGWNDMYSKDNFSAEERPERDGAFLVKNSWGENWGMSGYFWLSYETPITNVYAVSEVAKRDELFDTLYCYDDFGFTGYVGYGAATEYYSNSFTSASEEEELLTAASTYNLVQDTYFKVLVDTDTTDGIAAKEVELDGFNKEANGYYVHDAGYVTFRLKEPIKVSKNFEVKIQITNDSGNYKIPVEMKRTNYADQVVVSGNSKIGRSSTYMTKYTGGDVCLKAMTKKMKAADSPSEVPAVSPAASPTAKPDATPSATPTTKPAATPSAAPTVKPTATPSAAPTVRPTATPSAAPTVKPTATPSAAPTVKPTATPSAAPTVKPATKPTTAPTKKPAASSIKATVKRGSSDATASKILKKDKKNSNGLLIQASNVKKPTNLTISVKNAAGLKTSAGKRVYVYYVNSKTKKLEEMKNTRLTVAKGNTISVDVLKSGSYLVLPCKPSKNVVHSIASQLKANTSKKTLKVKKTTSFTVTMPYTLKKVSNLKKSTGFSGIGGATVSYKSNNKKIASVSSNGRITAKKKGTATITATVKLYSGDKRTFQKKIVVK